MDNNDNLTATNIGKAIKVAAAKEGVLMKDVAKHLGVSQATVSNLVKSSSSGFRYIDQLAELFNMSASELVSLGEVKE